MKLRYAAPLLAAAAAVSIAVAPVAMADPSDTSPDQGTCTDVEGADTQCQSPGNVQLTDAPPDVPSAPQYPSWQPDEGSRDALG
jgi:hypothetical protein